MPYLIDGHNLIPKFGISFSDENDEEQLVGILQDYFRRTRKGQIEVFFDKAATGTNSGKIQSFLKITFAKGGKSADDAILERLRGMGNNAKNWTVVSSDQYVQREAKRVGAAVMTSDEFAGVVRTELSKPSAQGNKGDTLSADEVERWMDLFNNQDK